LKNYIYKLRRDKLYVEWNNFVDRSHTIASNKYKTRFLFFFDSGKK
jgi:hypothetical protein